MSCSSSELDVPAEGAQVEFRLLGAVELRAGERRNGLGSAKARCTLAALAYDVGRPVSLDTLVHRLWDDDPPRRARDNLYTYVSRIRSALQKVGGDGAPALTSYAHTYILEADPDTVDLRRYLGLTARARALAESGDPERAIRLLDEAARLWRGEPLAGLSGSWAEHVRATAEAASVSATRTHAVLTMRLGYFADAVAGLSGLARRCPTDESLAGLLAVALHGCGRTAEAGRLLRRVTHTLVTEHGTDPGEELQRVQQGVLSGVPAVQLLPRTGGPGPGQERAAVPDNLPHDVPWVGRTEELHRLSTALAPGPDGPRAVVLLEAIDGMGGVGKTALAVHVAHELRERFPDGRIYLNLRAHATFQEPMGPEDALGQLLRLFGVPAEGLPRTLDELTAQWRTMLADRRAVVILDDAAGPEQVRPLLPGATPSQIIITSRRRLAGLPGVRPISLDVLRRSEAVALFRDRVGLREAGSEADGAEGTDEADTAEIVRLCGHLPLAIEIVASRFLSHGSWTAHDLVTRLARSDRLPEIRDGHRDLARTFDFSYRSLTVLQQTVFRRLSLHIGAEFGAYAAAALTGLPLDDTERALEDLLNVHLLQEPTPHRYRIHDLLREYARGLGAAEPAGRAEDEQAVQRLLAFYLHCADRADRVLYTHRIRIDVTPVRAPAESPTWIDPAGPQEWFATERNNLLAVLGHARGKERPREAALLVNALGGFLEEEGIWAVAQAAHRDAVAHWRQTGDRRAQARALNDLSVVSTHVADYDEAVRHADEALALARACGDAESEPEALQRMALPYAYTARTHEALACQQEALTLLMRTGNRLQQGRCLNNLGIMLLDLGRYNDAAECFLDALSRFREVDDRRGQCKILNNLGEIHVILGHRERAVRSYTQALALAKATGNRGYQATIGMNLARELLDSKDVEHPLALCRQALDTFRSMGERRHESIALNILGRALRRAGREDEALAHQSAALTLARRIGATHEEANALRELALTELWTGRLRHAAEHLAAALAIHRAAGAHLEEATTLDALAELCAQSGDAPGARKARREAADIREKLSEPLPDPSRPTPITFDQLDQGA
ncbi:AfsR/SARP family transcriptional regulator [Streptomyces hiroshimensis]|uniref:AfsR/SARP family transcriptional regulator n=1 Tax=Streptomyces hiroshimensis TaxID=66424 RepID=UPI0016755A50|nr:tetratricopeptide repeat protein [Streptomyces hiroshimensis]